MIFAEGTQVIYKEMEGIINFICEKYVVVKVMAKAGFGYPRLVVYRENYKKIEILKASTK